MVIRITLSLDPVDIDLVDRLAALQSINRSEQMRQFLAESRPLLRQTVETLEAAVRQKDAFMSLIGEAEAAGLHSLVHEVEGVQTSVIGAMARLEGALAAHEALDPRPSNHGGHTPNPSPEQAPE